MKVQLVSVRQSDLAREARCPELTPELLAACGARYSRNNEGLDSILSKVDAKNYDKSVDSIFKMIDYGHQSIADMVPVAMFIDGISIWLAYLIWSYCPTASGQESSTRYIRLSRDGVVSPHLLGLADDQFSKWDAFLDEAFERYNQALRHWEQLADEIPSVTKIPQALLDDPSDRAQKQVARMKRNFAFDRSRYFLPTAALTNVMLLMSARSWVSLCQLLLSHELPEANDLGNHIRQALSMDAPRLVKHAEKKGTTAAGLGAESEIEAHMAEQLVATSQFGEAAATARIDLAPPEGVNDNHLAAALQWHDNRYAWIGSAATQTMARFGWAAVAMAEVRDLNRHRTGTKYCPLVPLGFYGCSDQAEMHGRSLDSALSAFGNMSLEASLKLKAQQNPAFAAYVLLGHQFSFTHTTTLDKYIYEVELRTGTGAHFRYAKHFYDSITALKLSYPALARTIKIGTSEPE